MGRHKRARYGMAKRGHRSSLGIHYRCLRSSARHDSSTGCVCDTKRVIVDHADVAYKTVNFTPPVIEITEKPSRDEYVLIAPDGGTAYQKSPLITTGDGDLVWNGRTSHAFGFGVQKYEGEDVLVYWNGTSFPEPVGHGHGSIHILNKHYEEIANVSLPGNFVDLTVGETYESNIDLHEMYLTERGTILVLGNNVTQTDLRSVGGPENGWVVEAQVYEIDVKTNKVLFCWKSLEHLDDLSLNASVYPLGSEGYDGSEQSLAWGYFHITSVAPLGDGYILSSRYLSSAIALEAWFIQQVSIHSHSTFGTCSFI